LITDDKEFQNIFNNYVIPESRELDLKDVKTVLNDLSINFGYDLEPAKEFILLQHVNMT
jgi:hypothetical protein